MNSKNIISFFINHPDYFLKVISEHYPFSLPQLKKYEDILKWEYVSINKNINWSSDIIDYFTERLYWKDFTTNPSAFKDLTLLDRYENRIDWQGDEGFVGDSITENGGIKWDMALVEKYESKISFSKLSESEHVEWSEKLIDKYLNRLNLLGVGCNQSVPWTLRLFEKYLDNSYFKYNPVQGNIALISWRLSPQRKQLPTVSNNFKKKTKMEQLISIIKNVILTNTESLNGFSIFKYDRKTFDIYIPTKTIEAFYFISFIDGNFFDIFQNQIQLSEINTCKYSSIDLIEKNYLRILHYMDIYIEEHDMLSYKEYQSPRETGAEEYLDFGNNAFENGDYEGAFNYYSQAINLNPYDHSFYTKRASCFIKSKQYQNAIADICRAGISNPVSKQNVFTFTYEDIGNIYRLANDYQNAIKYYTLTFDNTQQWWLLQKRAICYSQLGIYDKAIQDFESILIEDRKIETLIQFAEVCLKGGFKNKAKSILNEVINFSSDNKEEWIVKMLEIKNQPIKEKAKKLLREI